MRKLIIFSLVCCLLPQVHGQESRPKLRNTNLTRVMVYPAPEGVDSSPDYQVTVIGGRKERASFTPFGVMGDEYTRLVRSKKANKDEHKDNRWAQKGTSRMSWTSFDFTRGPVTVKVKVLPGARHITLPLKSARVLPTSAEMSCFIDGEDTIVFQLAKPAKIMVVPNYEDAMAPYNNWDQSTLPPGGYEDALAWYGGEDQEGGQGRWEETPILEGFKNPLAIIARAPDARLPRKKSLKTLVIQPGKTYTQEELKPYTVLWFAPGMHDWSKMNKGPDHYTLLEPGQTVYLEGGAYVHGRLKARINKKGTPLPVVRGRGTLSGVKMEWIEPNQPYAMVNGCNVYGINITERPTCGIYHFDEAKDVALIASWHPNTDGVELHNAHIEDAFMMGLDDNLKLLGGCTAKKLVIWQGANAHPIMVQANANTDYISSLVEDVDVIMYQKAPGNAAWHLASSAVIACVRSGDSRVENFTFRNIRIEGPFQFRIFDLYNLDTSKVTAYWLGKTSTSKHTRLKNFVFENITVTSPVIFLKSMIRSDYEDSLSNITFRNIKINGIKVTEKNKADFFDVPFLNAMKVLFR